MGGRLVIHLDSAGGDRLGATRAARTVITRIGRWSDRLTRHSDASELAALNTAPESELRVGPTLAGALRAGASATNATDGLVDISLLDARLAVEAGASAQAGSSSPRAWSLTAGRRGTAIVRRRPGLRFDLDGIAKGWLADRALGLLSAWTSAVVDADGDLALTCGPGRHWLIAVDDPREPGTTLAILYLANGAAWPVRWGVATSGTSVHRWGAQLANRHHLIDPRTGAPAVTDIVQATVVCGSAAAAEGLAKAVVIAGSAAGIALLERSGVRGAVLLTERGETIATPGTIGLLQDPAPPRSPR